MPKITAQITIIAIAGAELELAERKAYLAIWSNLYPPASLQLVLSKPAAEAHRAAVVFLEAVGFQAAEAEAEAAEAGKALGLLA